MLNKAASAAAEHRRAWGQDHRQVDKRERWGTIGTVVLLVEPHPAKTAQVNCLATPAEFLAKTYVL